MRDDPPVEGREGVLEPLVLAGVDEDELKGKVFKSETAGWFLQKTKRKRVSRTFQREDWELTDQDDLSCKRPSLIKHDG